MNRADRRALLKHGRCKHDWQPKNAYYPDVLVCTKCTAIHPDAYHEPAAPTESEER